MQNPKLHSLRLLRDTQGLTTVEYVIVLALIAVVSVSAWQKFGSNVKGYLEGDTKKIDTAMKAQ